MLLQQLLEGQQRSLEIEDFWWMLSAAKNLCLLARPSLAQRERGRERERETQREEADWLKLNLIFLIHKIVLKSLNHLVFIYCL